MTANQSYLAELSRFLFRAPNWYSSVSFALIIAAVTGIGAFDSQFVLDDAYQGLFYVGIPTVTASLLTPLLDRLVGGQLTYNRSSLLALFCEVIVVGLLTAAGVVALLTPLGQRFVFDVLLGALAVVFAVRLAFIMALSTRKALLAALPASIQTVTAAALLFVYSGTLRFLEVGGPLVQAYLSRPEVAPDELLIVVPQDFLLLAIMSLLYSFGVWGLILVLDRPWRRGLGVSGFDMLRGFIGHIADGSRELEELFEDIGEEAIVPVTVLSFRRRIGASEVTHGAETPSEVGREKARFTLPMIHPGPMGEIGGGNLPQRVATDTMGLAFPPHATAGHDFNLVTEQEVDTLLDAARRAHDRIEYHETATESVRIDAGEASILGQSFGDDTLLVATFAPAYADDIEYGVGLSAIAEARSAGQGEVLLVDAHNCNDGLAGDDLGHVTPGSRRSFDLFTAARQTATSLSTAPQQPFELGCASDETSWNVDDGLGPLGIRVATVASGDHETAYVLIDGNNMEPGLRDRIIEAVEDIDEIEIMTTDTHVVNTMESTYQVGESIDHDELAACVAKLVREAREDYEPVVAGMAREHATVTVFGNDRTETLASHANAVISMGSGLAGAMVVAMMAISLLIFFFAAS